MFKLCYTVEPRFNEVPRDWGNLFVIHFSTELYIATALETQEQANKLLKTIAHINFILVGPFGIHCLSLADIYLLYRGKILRLRVWIVFVITRISLNRGSAPYILM